MTRAAAGAYVQPGCSPLVQAARTSDGETGEGDQAGRAHRWQEPRGSGARRRAGAPGRRRRLYRRWGRMSRGAAATGRPGRCRAVSVARSARAGSRPRPPRRDRRPPSLDRMLPTWTPTVFWLMNRRSPISRFVRPWAIEREHLALARAEPERVAAARPGLARRAAGRAPRTPLRRGRRSVAVGTPSAATSRRGLAGQRSGPSRRADRDRDRLAADRVAAVAIAPASARRRARASSSGQRIRARRPALERRGAAPRRARRDRAASAAARRRRPAPRASVAASSASAWRQRARATS